jgi:Na+/H+ antiporter NhaD/arsenite permease-like protein
MLLAPLVLILLSISYSSVSATPVPLAYSSGSGPLRRPISDPPKYISGSNQGNSSLESDDDSNKGQLLHSENFLLKRKIALENVNWRKKMMLWVMVLLSSLFANAGKILFFTHFTL